MYETIFWCLSSIFLVWYHVQRRMAVKTSGRWSPGPRAPPTIWVSGGLGGAKIYGSKSRLYDPSNVAFFQITWRAWKEEENLEGRQEIRVGDLRGGFSCFDKCVQGGLKGWEFRGSTEDFGITLVKSWSLLNDLLESVRTLMQSPGEYSNT